MKKQLSEMSVEELNQQQKSTVVNIGLITGALVVFTFIAFQEGFSLLPIIPVLFLPFVVINFIKLRKIKEELRSRG